MNVSLFSRPGAVLPILMSLAALALVLGHAALYGIVHEADEGTPAHIFQLLMGLQVPIVAFFAMNWLPRHPRQASLVLAVQLLVGTAAIAALYVLEHSS